MTGYSSQLEQFYKSNQKNKAAQIIENLTTDISIPLISDWATENRIYPAGVSEYPGPHDPDLLPHMDEIMNRCHPDDPCTHIYCMKSVQSAVTTTAESVIGAGIRYGIWNILYLTVDQKLAERRSNKNIDPMIDNSGLAEYMIPISTRTKRPRGDKALYKEFGGKRILTLNSYNSIGAMKSDSYGLIVCDEWTEAPAELKDQGDIEGVIEGRTMGMRKFKIFYISTPSTVDKCRMYKGFMSGDQRFLYCPCPICGEPQILVLKGGKYDYGLTFSCETDKETGNKLMIPESVRYQCQYCGGEFQETKKAEMLKHAEWRATVKPIDPKKTSYHIPGYIAGEVFLSWERICQQFINTDFGKDVLKFKDFTINFKGWPWASIEKAASWEVLRDRAENYCYGEVPDGFLQKTESGEIYRGALVLYAGVDVHGDRLEMHVVAFGTNSEKWSVDYQVFHGNTENIDDPCYMALHDWVYSHTYQVCKQDCYISKCAMDAGWDPRKGRRDKDFAGKNHIVYEFVSLRTDRFIAIMGVPDEKAVGIVKEARINDDKSTLTKRLNVAVSVVKELIMNVIEQKTGYGTIHFPRYTRIEGQRVKLPDDHYRQFLSERYQEIKKGEFGWFKFYTRNEVWDTFIYAIAAAASDNVQTWTNFVWMSYYYSLIDTESEK